MLYVLFCNSCTINSVMTWYHMTAWVTYCACSDVEQWSRRGWIQLSISDNRRWRWCGCWWWWWNVEWWIGGTGSSVCRCSRRHHSQRPPATSAASITTVSPAWYSPMLITYTHLYLDKLLYLLYHVTCVSMYACKYTWIWNWMCFKYTVSLYI